MLPFHVCVCVSTCVQKSWQPCRGMRQMCVSVITVIAPFTSSTLGGTAGQRHLDAHSTYMAIGCHWGVSWVVSQQQEGSLQMITRVCCVSVFCDRVYAFAFFVTVSVSLFPGGIFLFMIFLSVSIFVFHQFLSLPWGQLFLKYTNLSLFHRD